jgi:hypothetical protein
MYLITQRGSQSLDWVSLASGIFEELGHGHMDISLSPEQCTRAARCALRQPRRSIVFKIETANATPRESGKGRTAGSNLAGTRVPS